MVVFHNQIMDRIIGDINGVRRKTLLHFLGSTIWLDMDP